MWVTQEEKIKMYFRKEIDLRQYDHENQTSGENR